MIEETKVRWRWGVVATLAMILLSLYPHLHFRISRGSAWNGSYTAIEGVGDEVAYSAYVNALMAGRPRRNDPYSGRDDQGNSPQPESLFSIQFVPAYLIALTANALSISAATAFIALTPLAAGATSLALFWLLLLATRDGGLAAAGTIVVLCLGTIVGGHGLFAGLFGGEPLYNYLMFLRRYQPAASFPLLLLFCALVWQTMNLKNRKAATVSGAVAGTIFGLLVFSYVYLWTAAIAWLASLAFLWMVAKPPAWRDSLKSLGIVMTVSLAALLPFAALYARRAVSLEAVQALETTHRPDLFRLPELISIAVLLILAWLIRRRVVVARDPGTLFTVSFALLPMLVFNQQVISGVSMQPLHYEMFAANYSVLIAIILLTANWFRSGTAQSLKRRRKALLWIAIAAFEWGGYETLVATGRSMEFAKQLDEARPVALRLEKLARHDEKPSGDQTRAMVLSTDLLAADGLPTTASHAILWAPHMLVFSGVTAAESKERFHQYLYYTGITPARLKQILRNEHQYGFAAGMFGFERTIKGLSLHPKPITATELEDELNQYGQYCLLFSHARAQSTELSYLIVPGKDEPDLANLDRWYERDGGERVGNYTLYRVRLRASDAAMNGPTAKPAVFAK